MACEPKTKRDAHMPSLSLVNSLRPDIAVLHPSTDNRQKTPMNSPNELPKNRGLLKLAAASLFYPYVGGRQLRGAVPFHRDYRQADL
jgi:hypothetical protein